MFFHTALAYAMTDPTRPLFLSEDKKNEEVINTKISEVATKQYKLEAVFISEKRSVVIINGKEYQKGDVIDAYILHDIHRDHVRMKKGNKQKMIYLYPDNVVKAGGE